MKPSVNAQYLDAVVKYLSVLSDEQLQLTQFNGKDAYLFPCPFCTQYVHNTEAKQRKTGRLIRVQKDEWIEIDSNLDAFRLTEVLKPDISINRPFTSTAYVTNFYKIPSIYYDPSKKLDKSKYSFVEIELINEYKKLNDWALKSIKI